MHEKLCDTERYCEAYINTKPMQDKMDPMSRTF